jgi:hypothetical protein
MTDVKAPPTAAEMLHPKVLDVFGGKPSGHPRCSLSLALKSFGYVDVTFPSLLNAAQWVKVWADETEIDPPVMLYPQSTRGVIARHSFTAPVKVCVLDE